MNIKKAPYEIATLQGANLNNSDNINQLNNNVKSKNQINKEYRQNSITRFVLQHSNQNTLLSNGIINFNSNYYKCHRASFSSYIEIMRNKNSQRAYYQSIITCSSWLCPVCSPRIMGVRSAEIRKAVHQWLNTDELNTCYMMTLTFSHKITDSLDSLLGNFKKALKHFWENGSLIRSLNTACRVGRITSTEIQYSKNNGWHPHQHILIFCKKHDFDSERLSNLWVNSLKACGLSGLSDIAFDLIEARSAENYLTKISSEMALGNLKQGHKTGHYSPLQIMEELENKSSWAITAFNELFKSTRGMHWLCWSAGLKACFDINNVTDEQITKGKADFDLDYFMFLQSTDFKKLPAAKKAVLRNYASFNQRKQAIDLLGSFDIQELLI